MMSLNKALVLLLTATYSITSLAQAPLSNSNGVSTVDIENPSETSTNYTSAQILPAYKLALKKGMFDFSGGLGHTDVSNGSLNGQSNNIKTNPQTDFVPLQLGYAFTDNTYFSVSGRALQERDRETRTSFEGFAEPQLSLSYLFRNENSGLQISLGYTPDMGAREITYNGISRVEGNALNGGSSTEAQLGYFFRIDSFILGGEASYLYKDTRIVNESNLVLGQKIKSAQTRYEGGAEKTIRGIAELAAPFRVGGFIGRTWVELEERMVAFQPAPIFVNSHYKDFYGVYTRFQVLPRFSILPILSFGTMPDTSGLSRGDRQEVTTQVNLRYRF